MYNVAVLIEKKLEEIDAQQVVSLHDTLEQEGYENVSYHVILPVESSTAIMASSLSVLGGGEILPLSAGEELEEISKEIRRQGQDELEASLALLRPLDPDVKGYLAEDDPLDELEELVRTEDIAEVIIITSPHLVAEFFRLDWTSRARRKLDVPTLHLLEHLPFEAQR